VREKNLGEAAEGRPAVAAEQRYHRRARRIAGKTEEEEDDDDDDDDDDDLNGKGALRLDHIVAVATADVDRGIKLVRGTSVMSSKLWAVSEDEPTMPKMARQISRVSFALEPSGDRKMLRHQISGL